MTDVDDPRQLSTAGEQFATLKGPISKRDEVAMRVQERKRLENENLTFQPTLHARQGKQTVANAEPFGSRFDRLYGDAVKRQSGEMKYRNDENQQSHAVSVLPTRSRSSSTDRRSTDTGSSFSRVSSVQRMASKEGSKDPTVILPASMKRSKSVDRSQSITASIARLHSSKDQPVEKLDEKKVEKTNSATTDVAPTFLAPKVRSSSMVFIANPTAATTLSAQDRLRLLAENKSNKLETEPTRQRSRASDGIPSQTKQLSQPKRPSPSEAVGTASSRGRDASVKAVAGSRFDTLYRDAMKRKNEDPSLRIKYLERVPFKPTISPSSRSVSKDRSGIDVSDKQQRMTSSRRILTPPATDNVIFKVGAPLSRSSSVDRTSGKIRDDQLNQKKPMVRKTCGDQHTLIKTQNIKDEIEQGQDTVPVVTRPASDYDKSQNGNVEGFSSPEAPVAVIESVGKGQGQSDDGITAALRDALVGIVDNVAGVSLNIEPAEFVVPQNESDSTMIPNENILSDTVERTHDQVLDVSELTDVDDHVLNKIFTEPIQGNVESSGLFSDSRNNENTSNFKPASAPFRSPGMRSRSASTDKRRFSIGSSGAVNLSATAVISSMPIRSKDAICDDAKTKADENRRLKSERDSADARLKALRADRSVSSSNVLRGGTAFAISNTQDQPFGLKAGVSASPGR